MNTVEERQLLSVAALTQPFEVEAFGRDCLGNISGYQIVKRVRGVVVSCAGHFFPDESGSYENARHEADEACAKLNAA